MGGDAVSASKTVGQLREFIAAQPDGRSVSMCESTAGPCRCGCVLIQFYRDQFPSVTAQLKADWNSVYVDTDLPELVVFGATDLIKELWFHCGNIHTYADVKRVLNLQ